MQSLRGRYEALSRREREVMVLVVAGRLNKQVGGGDAEDERALPPGTRDHGGDARPVGGAGPARRAACCNGNVGRRAGHMAVNGVPQAAEMMRVLAIAMLVFAAERS